MVFLGNRFIKRYNNLKKIREVKFIQLPGGSVSIGAVDGSGFNGVVAENVVSSTAKISNLICQYYNRCLLAFV